MITKRFFILLFSTFLAVSLHFPAQSQEQNGLNLAIAAQELYSAGKLTSAASTWQQSAQAFKEQKNRLGATKSSINQAQVLQDLGLYPKACDTLLEAFEVENPDCAQEQINRLITQFEAQSKPSTIQAVGLRSLGNILSKKGQLDQSQRLLQLSKAGTEGSTELGATLLALGNVERALANKNRDRQNYDQITEIIDRQDPNLALEPYRKAFSGYKNTAASKQALPITQVQAQLNYLNLLLEIEDWWQAQINRRLKTWQRQEETRLIEAATNFSDLLELRLASTKNSLITNINRSWSNITPSHESIYARINYTRSLIKLGNIKNVEPILQTALAEAQVIQDTLGESYVWGYLGKYYGQQEETAKAISLTQKALITAQRQNINYQAREIAYLWHSQLGQLLEQQGDITEAISSYTSAFNTLQSLRVDLNANNQVVQFDFRQEVKPVYLHLANLLLQSDETPRYAKRYPLGRRQAHPRQSLQRGEPPQRAVSQGNAHQDSDRPQSPKSSQLISQTTNSSSNSNLELARQVIESLQLAELDNFFQDPCSETTEETVTIDQIDSQAAVIYPIVLSDRLEVILSLPNQPLQKFTTIVGETKVNQTVDLLYDSLYNPSVNNSAVNIFSTTMIDPKEVEENMQTLLPILQQINSWLIEPLTSSLAANQVQTLVFVLNGRLQNVPISALYDGQKYLLEKYGVALAPSLQLLHPQAIARDKVKVLAAGLSQQVEVQGTIFPALNNVPSELNQIENIFPKSHQLLDLDFTTSTIEKQLKSGFSIVHLATHGIFSSNPDETFIITGDGEIIDINALSNLLSSSNISPELVILSACETAAGDELAILGLAGVAVRSGASSTIASLWSVDDASTARLMSDFYQEFKNPQAKKVDALQKAQLSLIDSLRDNSSAPTVDKFPPHPYYWSPYVLVGNWQ